MAILSWSGRRQLIYYGVGIILLIIFVLVVWATFFNTAPTCFDGKQNGAEQGIDCGGSCALVCQSAAHDPVALWTRAFQTGPTAYTAVAYIQNNNQGAGAKNVAYTFQLLDSNNNLVKEVQGTTDLPPVQTIPIIETNIDVGNRTVARAFLCFHFDPHCSATPTDPPRWNKVLANAIPTLKITQQSLSADASRLGATVVNTTLQDARQVTIAAVLFDSQGVARAASKSVLPPVPAQSSVPVVFTWANGVQGVARAEMSILPSF